MRLSEAHSEQCYFGATNADMDPELVAKFIVWGEPITKSRARYSRKTKTFYTPKNVTEAESRVASGYLEATKKASGDNAHNTFGVIVVFHLTTRQRRDVDNMLKLVMDGLTGVAWADDSQVTEVVARKVAAFPEDSPRTEVVIYHTVRTLPPNSSACQKCGKRFRHAPSWDKHFCSKQCRTEALRSQRARTCDHCGTSFDHAHPSHETRFCSRACKTAATHIAATCAHCGKDFTKPKHLNRAGRSYCSDDCRREWWRLSRKSKAAGTCNDCGGPTTKKTYIRCQDCHFAAGGAKGSQRRKLAGLE